MARPSTLELVARLADTKNRADAVVTLAARLGVDTLVVFVPDAQLSVLLPAPGFPQTIPGGPSWRELLGRCKAPGFHEGEVSLSFGDERHIGRARAWADADGSVLVLLGGAPVELEVEVVRQALPLLSAALKGEQAAVAAMGHVEVARDAERHARTLATALDATRADLEHALAEAARLGGERAMVAEDLQKRSEEALRRAEETAQLREQFIAILGHDLRSPLSAIVLTAEALGDGECVPAARVKHAQRILRSTQRIGRMVDDLLDFARTRLGGGMPITPALIDDLPSLFGQVVDEIRAAHPDRRIDLEVEQATGLWWDKDRMAQVLSNLVGNALEHSPPDTAVRVSAEVEGDFVLVRVQNWGAPIPPAILAKIFEPFQRGTDAATGVRSGLGLGLHITDTVVRAHGGVIAVSSSEEAGTTFVARLPRRAPGA